MSLSPGLPIDFDTLQFFVLNNFASLALDMARASTRSTAAGKASTRRKACPPTDVSPPSAKTARVSPRKLTGLAAAGDDVHSDAGDPHSQAIDDAPSSGRRGRAGGRSKKILPEKTAEIDEEQNPFVDNNVAPVESADNIAGEEVDQLADDEDESTTPKAHELQGKRKRDVSSPTPRAAPASRGIKQPRFVSPTPQGKAGTTAKRTPTLGIDRPPTPRPPRLAESDSGPNTPKVAYRAASPDSDVHILSTPPSSIFKSASVASGFSVTPATPRISKTMKREIIVLDESDSEDRARSETPFSGEPFDLQLPDILSALKQDLLASGIASRLRNTELQTHYPSERPMTFPITPDVLTWAYNDAQVVALYDALNFPGCGVYVNPLRADPADFFVDASSKLTHKSGRAKNMAAVLVLPLLVGSSSLTKLASIRSNNSEGDTHYRLRGAPPPDIWPVALGFLGACYKRDNFHAYLMHGQIQLSTKPLSFDSQSPKKRGGATLSSNTPSSKLEPKTGSEYISYPSARPATTPVPIYDGRFDGNNPIARPGFYFSEREWRNLSALPRFGNNKAEPKELKTCRQDEQYQVVLAGFTITTFVPKNASKQEVHISFNIQFTILLADYVRHTEDTRPPMTVERVASYRERLFSSSDDDDDDDFVSPAVAGPSRLTSLSRK